MAAPPPPRCGAGRANPALQGVQQASQRAHMQFVLASHQDRGLPVNEPGPSQRVLRHTTRKKNNRFHRLSQGCKTSLCHRCRADVFRASTHYHRHVAAARNGAVQVAVCEPAAKRTDQMHGQMRPALPSVPPIPSTAFGPISIQSNRPTAGIIMHPAAQEPITNTAHPPPPGWTSKRRAAQHPPQTYLPTYLPLQQASPNGRGRSAKDCSAKQTEQLRPVSLPLAEKLKRKHAGGEYAGLACNPRTEPTHAPRRGAPAERLGAPTLLLPQHHRHPCMLGYRAPAKARQIVYKQSSQR